MAEVIPLLRHRPAPYIGPDVHLYNFHVTGHVIQLHNAQVIDQWHFDTFDDAREHARQLADRLGCAMIEHHPYANRNHHD